MTQPKAKYHAETTITTEKFEYTWVLKNFKHFYGPAGYSIKSPIFSMQMNESEYKWSAELYPRRVGQSIDQCVSEITLSCISSQDPPTTAHFIANLHSLTSDKIITRSVTANYQYNSGHYTYTCGSFEQPENFLSNGNLTIEFVVYLRNTTFVSAVPVLEVEEKRKPTLRHRSGFSDFKQLFKSMELSDVTIIIGDEQIAAHKCILAARSPVFSAMFNHETEEKKRNVVRIPDIDHKVMIELLRFMYCEEVEDIEEIAMDLLVAADKYDINDLRVWCEEVLSAELSMENIGDLLIFIDTLPKATKLRAAVFLFISSHLKELKKSEEFQKTMESLSSSLLTGLINDIELNM